MKLPIDYAAIDARRAALKARVLAFIHEGYALAAETEKEFKVKIPVELYQYTEKGAGASFSGPGEPDADVYTDAEHSAEDFYRGYVWTGRGDAEDQVALGDIGDPTEIEGVSITAEDVEWFRWLAVAHVCIDAATDEDIEELHCTAFPDEWAANQAKLTAEYEAAEAQREANKPKPAPVEFDPFHDDN